MIDKEKCLVDIYYEVDGVLARCQSGIKVSEIPSQLAQLFRNISEFYASYEEILRSVYIVEHNSMSSPEESKIEMLVTSFKRGEEVEL